MGSEGRTRSDEVETVQTSRPHKTSAADLFWLPLGAGGHSVRLNGRIFETVAATLAGRARRDLYHSALIVHVPEGRFVIEQTPVPDRNG